MKKLLIAGLALLPLIPTGPPAPQSARSGFVLVANQQSASASLINLSNDSMKLIPVGTGPHEAVISPSGRTGIVTIYGTGPAPGNQIAVIDIASGTVRSTISLGPYTRPHGANFLPGNETRVVVTSEATQKILIVDLAKGIVQDTIPTGAQGSHMVGVTQDASRAFTSDVGSGAVSAMDLKTKQLIRVTTVAPRVEGIAVTPSGDAVWAGSNTNGTVTVLDGRTGAVRDTLKGFSMPYRLAMSADGKTAIICDPQGNKIHVADVAARRVTWTLDSLGSPRGVNIAPDGKTAFVTLAADETVGVIDLVNRTLVRKIKVGASPDGVWYGPAPAR